MKAGNLQSLETRDGEIDVWCVFEGGSEVRSCTVFWVFRAWLRWWGVVDWDGLGMWSVRVERIGRRPIEVWRYWGRVRAGAVRFGENVWNMTRMSLVCTLNGQGSGICGEASYRGKRLTLAERGRNGSFKNKWWWWRWWWWWFSLIFSLEKGFKSSFPSPLQRPINGHHHRSMIDYPIHYSWLPHVCLLGRKASTRVHRAWMIWWSSVPPPMVAGVLLVQAVDPDAIIKRARFYLHPEIEPANRGWTFYRASKGFIISVT